MPINSIEVPACLAVCTPDNHIYIVVLGLIFGILALLVPIIYLIIKRRYKNSLKKRYFIIIFILFSLIFMLYTYENDTGCGSGCNPEGMTKFEGFRFFPTSIWPETIR